MNKLFISNLFCLAILALTSCGHDPVFTPSTPKVKQQVKVVMTQATDSALGCGASGYTIVQFPDGHREKWCGIWGSVGDQFLAESNL